MFSEHPDILFAFFWVRINLLWSFQIMVKVVRTFLTGWYELRKMHVRYLDVQKTSPRFACNFYSWKNIVYTFLFLILLITIITSGNLKVACVLNANDMHINVMLIGTFWYLIFIFLSSYELVMNFQSFGQTVKGHSRDHDGKSKGKTEQARKVRAKPMGRNQLGVKMQLSLKISFLAG